MNAPGPQARSLPPPFWRKPPRSMRPFELLRPDSPAAAVDTGAAAETNPEAMFIAGGTNVVDLAKYHVFAPGRLVSVGAVVPREIRLERDRLVLGAGATMTEVAYHDDVVRHFPGIRDGLLLAASQGIRNAATIGGNVMQRTRCPYYRDPSFACNRRAPGSGCAALEGWNRYNAILGGSDACIAAHFSDVANVFAALEATVVALQPGGRERAIAFADFHRLPGDTPEREFALAPGEVVLRIEVPRTPAAANSCYVKIRDRNSYAFAIASAAAGLALGGDGRVADAKLALGAVGTVPWKVPAAERHLVGKPATEEHFRRAAAIAVEGAEPREHNAFKVDLVQGALVEALNQLSAA